MKSKWIGILAITTVFACKGQDVSKAPATELEGSWQSACLVTRSGQAYRETFVFSGNAVVKTTAGFTNEKCEQLAYSLRQSSRFEIVEAFSNEDEEEGIKTIDFIAVDATLAAFRDEVVKEFSKSSHCGISEWILGKTEVVSGQKCWGDTQLPARSETSYNIYLLKDGALTFGEMESGVGLPLGFQTRGERPQALDSRTYQRQ